MATGIAASKAVLKTSDVAPPPLENGDRLTRYEFERRYEAMSPVKKAELIEGIVYMPSPVRNSHGQPHSHIVGWLVVYEAATSGVYSADNTTVRLDSDNEPQPDALLRLDPAVGGNCRVAADDYLEGPPELIVEIAGSSAAYDLHDKMNAYRRNGVQEYIVWQVHNKHLDWFQLKEGVYRPLTPDEEGVIHSQVFPGLRLVVMALLAGDLAVVLTELNRGLASAAHAAFVERLSRKKG